MAAAPAAEATSRWPTWPAAALAGTAAVVAPLAPLAVVEVRTAVVAGTWRVAGMAMCLSTCAARAAPRPPAVRRMGRVTRPVICHRGRHRGPRRPSARR